ncbi:MAG: hypothetical protein KA154_17575 [Gemmatimonadaceae bacterium]|nr:hypothetical protein [Gemmatimonadaceae bacterium]MCC6243346.1 hypothetical protein [Gemmatimonadaceae bacterium]
MEKRVNISTLKAQLSVHLRDTRAGQSLTICDGDTPIARLVPYHTELDALQIRMPTRALAAVRLPKPLRRDIGSGAVLLELRQWPR